MPPKAKPSTSAASSGAVLILPDVEPVVLVPVASAAAAPLPAAASASAAAAPLTVAQKQAAKNVARLAEAARLNAEILAAQEVEPTPSETGSLDARLAAIDAKHAPSSEEQLAALELESGVVRAPTDTLAVLQAKFDALDLKYTQKAVDEWKLRVAYLEKRREVSKLAHQSRAAVVALVLAQ